MSTKKLSFNQKEGKKAGVNNTQTTLTAAGLAAAVGVAGGAAAACLAGGNDEDENAQPQDVNNETAQKEETTETPQETAETPQETDATEQPETVEASNNADTPDATDPPSQPGPTTGNGTQPDPTTGNGTQPDPTTINNTQPVANNTTAESTEQVVAELLGEDEVDTNDIEAPTEIAMDRFTTVYDEDGNEIDAAVIHAPDGSEYVLVDLDGDGTYDMLCTPDLAQSMPMELMLTHSDMESQLGAGGYMAFVGSDPQPPATDVTADIIDTNTGGHVDVASNQPAVAEEIDDEASDDIVAAIVAALLDNETDDGDETLVAQDVENLLDDDELDDNDETEDFDDFSEADADLDDELEA